MESLMIDKLSDSGYGYGYGSGCGSGYGYDYDYGCGCGSGSSDGSGSGYGYGYGFGSDYGSGYGYGSGSGYGYGFGFGCGCGILSFKRQKVYMIDGIQSVITAVYGNVAKGFILQQDLSLSPCYIAKQGDVFAHGDTLKQAVAALADKLFDDMPEDERIDEFFKTHDSNKKYPARDLYDWHHKLTGSCEAGRMAFVKDHEIDLDTDTYTVSEFVELCKNSYGGDTIKKLRDRD